KDERDNLRPLVSRVKAAPLPPGWRPEIVFVDDGSADGSHLVLDELADADPAVKVVRLRRNFGQTAALQAGIDHAAGDVLATKYGLTRTFRVLLDLITVSFLSRYLTRPMHFFGFAGLTLMALGAVSLAATFVMKQVSHIFMTGNPLLLLSVMLELMGIQFIS